NVLLVVLVLCFVACDPDEETTRNTNTETNTTVVVDPVTTQDICLECGENLFWYDTNRENTGEIINDTIDFVSKLYRFGDYYRLNIDAFTEWHNVRVFSFLICNQNKIKEKLDLIWNSFSKDGVWNIGQYNYDYRLVKSKFVIAYKVINETGLENHFITDNEHNVRFWNYGIYMLEIEKTDEEFSWIQNGFNLDSFFELQGFLNH
ncbi:MAG: hypothetical protein KBT30_02110, partial [Clostridiales bacterium]|nr:hypothetical protein [Candidatus Apopatousia equi]